MPRRSAKVPLSGVAPLLAQARKIARQQFDFSKLHPGQKRALESVLDGRDTLAILPTGGGKSAIYQLAGMVIPGPTLVVSPLVALQKDQVEHIESFGECARALNSSLSAAGREEALREFENGDIEFLLLAPEQLSNSETLERLKAAKPSLFVVDEAHCVSQWGHDFRPDFLRLHLAVEALGRPVVLALTATASPPVRAEICERLRLREPNVVVAGFDRPNLKLEVRAFGDSQRKTEALLEAVVEGPKPAITYAATREKTETLAAELTARGVEALAYHAGLSKKLRDERQSAFMNNEAPVMVATIAFGMGVDKPDVRRVWHHDVSDALDSYYQEAGRAGRDGEGAEAVLFYCPSDLGVKKFQASGGAATVKNATQIAAVLSDLSDENGHVTRATLENELHITNGTLGRALAQLEELEAIRRVSNNEIEILDDLNPGLIKRETEIAQEKAHEWDRSRLEMMRRYAEATTCRRQILLGYFGEEKSEPCGNCDVCLGEGTAKIEIKAERTTEELAETQRAEIRRVARNRARGSAGELASNELAPDELTPGVRVRHPQWGEGEILRVENDALTLVFNDAGYKTLSLQVVRSNRLLQAVSG